jgi:nucleoside-diphosphate-sugar epimerase
MDVRPEIVFHLAGRTAAARDLALVNDTFRDNLETSVNVLSAAAAVRRCHVVLAGSLEEPIPVDAGAVPSSPYAASKWAASMYGRMFHALFNVPVTSARIFMVYGPGQREIWKLIPSVTLSLLHGEAPRLGSGRRRVDWIYVDDVVEGLVAIACRPVVGGQTVDLGMGTLTTIRDVVHTLAELVGGSVEPIFGAIPDRPYEQERVADTERSFRLLGWRPATTLRQGLERTVASYRHLLEEERASRPLAP